MEDINNIIIISLIVLVSFYIYNSSMDYRTPTDYLESHKTCPVMGGKTYYSACIHYPPFNMGFTVSVCCKDCISEIQKSFKKDDKKYMITKENDYYYLVKDDINVQLLKLCSRETIDELISKIGTKKTTW